MILENLDLNFLNSLNHLSVSNSGCLFNVEDNEKHKNWEVRFQWSSHPATFLACLFPV